MPFSICYGETIEPLYIGGTGIKWYSDAELDNLVYEGNTFNTGKTEPGVYLYYVTQTSGGSESDATPVSLSIYELPSEPEITEESYNFCPGDILEIINYDGQYDYQWYLDDAPLIGQTGYKLTPQNNETGKYKLKVSDKETACAIYSDSLELSLEIPEMVLKGEHVFVCKNLEEKFSAYQ